MTKRRSNPPTNKDSRALAINGMRSPMCGAAFRKLLLAPPPAAARAPNSRNPVYVSSYHVSGTKVSSDEQSLLVGAGESSASNPLVLGGNRDGGPYMHEGRMARSPGSQSGESDTEQAPAKPDRTKIAGFFTANSKPSSYDDEYMEAAPYLMLQFSPSEESSSPSPQKKYHQELNFSILDAIGDRGEENNNSKMKPNPGVTPRASDGNKEGMSLAKSANSPLKQTQRHPYTPSSNKSNTIPNEISSVSRRKSSHADVEGEGKVSERGEPSNTADMMVALRAMMQKQQNSMKEMERENKRVREELADYRKLLEEANNNRSRQDETIVMLSDELSRVKADKEDSQETFSPRTHKHPDESEELDGPSFAGVEQYHQERQHPKVSTASSHDTQNSTELNQYREIKKKILSNKHVYGDILEADDSFLKFDSVDTFSEVFPNPRDKDDGSTTDTSTNSSANSNGDNFLDIDQEKSLLHHQQQRPQENCEFPASVDCNPLLGSFEQQDDPQVASSEISRSVRSMRSMDSDIVSQSSAARSKEEVTLFKSRLQEIQRKRELRKRRESGYGSRSGQVNFE